MKELIRKIRQILRDKRTRRFFTRFVSTFAAVVVFITTYALILPAITMEKEADCGIEAHQHDETCYEDVLICDLPEAEAHVHTDACYQVQTILSCSIPEHQHSVEEGCYDEDGMLVCENAEHIHSDACYEEQRDLICGLEETEGHVHDSSCYEKILTCGKEVHIHSAECYTNDEDEADLSVAGVSSTAAAAVFEEDTDVYGEDPEADPLEENAADASMSSPAGNDSVYGEDPEADVPHSHPEDGQAAEEDAAVDVTVPEEEPAEGYVPVLEPVEFNTVLDQDTDIYYYAVSDGEIVEDSAAVTEWEKVEDDTELGENDLLRVYLHYTIPAGSLNETNETARYRLPANIHLTDAQYEAVNASVNGIAAQYVRQDTLEILDVDAYHKYLGLEAVEGTRAPSDDIREYLRKHDGQEFISATVRAEDVFDHEGIYGEKGAYLGTDLVFTFVPYTIEKNRHEYDRDGQPTKAGEKVQGWLTFDLNTEQIDWEETEVLEDVDGEDRPAENAPVENTVYVEGSAENDFFDNPENEENDENEAVENGIFENDEDSSAEIEKGEEAPVRREILKEAEIVFAEENPQQSVREISTDLVMREQITEEPVPAEDPAEEDPEETEVPETDPEEEEFYTTEDEEDTPDAEKTEDPNADAESVEPEQTEAEAADPDKEQEKTGEEKKSGENPADYPPVTFDGSITADAGSLPTDLSGISEEFSDTELAQIPARTELRVHVEADAGTFPEGTQMVLEPVEDLDSVAAAVEEAVDSRTRGFHAVDISFRNAEGVEIEPLKPVRVNISSEAIRRAAEDSSTDAVVVHVEDADSGHEDHSAGEGAAAGDASEDAADAAPEEAATSEDHGAVESAEPGEAAGIEETPEAAGSGEDVSLEETVPPEETVTSEVAVSAEDPVSSEESASPADAAESQDTLTFEAGAFSVYAVVYTVDFHYEVNGKVYDFSIPGGGFISLEHLVEVLGISSHGAEAEEEGDTSEEGTDNTGAAGSAGQAGSSSDAVDLQRAEVSAAARRFVSEVENVEFSTPGLVWTGKTDRITTIGALKEANGLEVRYSAGLTERQIDEINAQTVEAGDWALISVLPFTSEETLTVTMQNGDQFVIRVTDEHRVEELPELNLDVNNTFIICYEETTDQNETIYHVLKTDGSVDNTKTPEDFDKLGEDYQWSFYYVFTEKDRWTSLDYTYYFIRPVAKKTHTIALNVAGEDLVQYGTNNVAVIPQQDGGYVFLGYNHTDNIHIELGFEGGEFVSYNDVSDNPKVIQIYRQEEPDTYDYTVDSADFTMGTVSMTTSAATPVVTRKTHQVEQEGGTFVNQTHKEQIRQGNSYVEIDVPNYYYEAETDGEKKNSTAITATAVPHLNTNLNSSETGYGQNKYLFDYFDINGVRVPAELVTVNNQQHPTTATIDTGALEIDRNNSIVTAHFKQNPDYIVPKSEKQGRTASDLQKWLEDLKDRNIPLNEEGCNKTAEVYDYENRIYRVDLTAQSNLTTFDGTIDLGFIMDISSSMRFPSVLKLTDDNRNHTARRISQINQNYSNWGLQTSKTYYIIGDESETATVFRIYWNGSAWRMEDASKSETHNPSNNYTNTAGVTLYSNSQNYLIYEADDPVTAEDLADPYMLPALQRHSLATLGVQKNRAVYLEYSVNKAIDEMNELLRILSLANDGAENPDVKIAWNTFCSTVNNSNPNFTSATGNVDITYSYSGGTSTQLALDNAAAWDWGSSNTNYAVLITDGAPQRNGQAISNAVVGSSAEGLIDGRDGDLQTEDDNVTLITVGLSMGNVERGKELLYDIASKDEDGQKLFFNAEYGNELEDVLLQILKTIMTDATVHGDVKDTISEAFYPVDKNTGLPLERGATIDLDGNLIDLSQYEEDQRPPYGTITYTRVNVGTEEEPVMEYRYGVTWTGQDFDWNGWNGTVYVKAKEDLLGGNAMKTNEGYAQIEAKSYTTPNNPDPILMLDKKYLDEEETEEDPKYIRVLDDLESPRVNVNELSFLSEMGTDWTVYLGTEVDPKEQLKKLYDEIIVGEVIHPSANPMPGIYGFPDTVSSAGHYYDLPNEDADPSNDLGDFSDNREKHADEAEQIANKQTFRMADLIRLIAESSEDGTYPWWDYAEQDIEWDTFIELAKTTGLDENNKPVTVGFQIPYRLYGLDDNSNITIMLEKKIVEEEKYYEGTGAEQTDVTLENGAHATKAVGDGVEQYDLTVVFSPDYTVVPVGQGGSARNETMHVGTFGTLYQGHAAGTETSKVKHVINVYAADLDVLKTDGAEGVLPGAVFTLYKADEENGSAVEGLSGKYVQVATGESGQDGVAHLTTENGLQTGVNYFLVEETPPEGYLKDKTVWLVQVQTEIGTYTALDGTVLYTKEYPFNWDQGARILADGQPVIVIARGAAAGTTVEIDDGSYVSHKDVISFRHEVENKLDQISVTVNKSWVNEEDPPASISFHLYRVSEVDHRWGSGTIVPNTCTENGVKLYTCSECGATKTEAISAEGHTWGTEHRENIVPATCLTAGSYDNVVRCTVCDAILFSEHIIVPATGHSWGEPQHVEAQGDQYCYDTVVKCTVCGETNESTRVHHAHTWETIRETASPGAQYCYESVNQCAVCEYTDETTRAQHGHDWGEWHVTTSPTASHEGEETRICNNNPYHKQTRPIAQIQTTRISYRTYQDYYGYGWRVQDLVTALEFPVGSTVTLSWSSDSGFNARIYYGTARQTTYQGNTAYTFSGTSTPVTRSGSNYSVTVTVTNGMVLDIVADQWLNFGFPTISFVQNANTTSSTQSSPRSLSASPGLLSLRSPGGKGLLAAGDGPVRAGEEEDEEEEENPAMTGEQLEAYLETIPATASCDESEEGHLYKEIVSNAQQQPVVYTVTAADGWTLNLDDLPKYNEYGKEYTYYVVETPESAAGHTVSYTGQDTGLTDEGEVTIINDKAETSVNIRKVAGNDASTGTALAGAVFKLKKDQEYVRATETNGLGTVQITAGGETLTFTDAIQTTGGLQTISGLRNGTYTLEEVYIPPGYTNRLGNVTFVIRDGVVSCEQAAGNVLLEFSPADGTEDASLTIANTFGAELPASGGPGTSGFFLMGILLTAFAGAGIMMRKRQG